MVSRLAALPGSRPINPSNNPITAATRPFITAPRLSAATMPSPTIAIAAISENPNSKTNGRTTGIASVRTAAPMSPPIAETA